MLKRMNSSQTGGRMAGELTPTHEAPYKGLRVLDFGQGIASPYCAMLLGVYGAEIIKVEPPEGDWSRFLGTTYGSHTALSAVYNRGKRSLCLDVKHKDGIAIAKRLARDSDVLIEGFRPGVAARLGLGYEELSRDNPGLIYLSISGFGQSGPYSKRPGSDSVAQAFSGLVSINAGTDGVPHRVGTTISDVVTGVYAFQAIATALIPQLREIFRERPTEAWLTRLHATDVIAERIHNPGEWLRSPHVEATRAAVCQDTPGVGLVYSPRTPGIASLSEDDLRPAPDIGQDSVAVLLEAGFDRGGIDHLLTSGAVRQAKGGGH